MSGSFSGISSYQQAGQAAYGTYKANNAKDAAKSSVSDVSKKQSTVKSDNDVKVKEYKPLSATSSLIPTEKAGYGTVVGDVELSDKAKEYYNKLKEKFHGMDFVLVSNDLKSEVAKNYSAYGNANRQVVLIDEEKLERMATDEAYRKKYEGIIESSTAKMTAAKNSLVSAGAVVKNFGMSVAEDGTTSFFATIQKNGKSNNDALKARQAKKKEEKKEASKKAEKAAKKKQQEERIEEKRAETKQKSEKLREEMISDDNSEDIFADNHDYLNFESSSLDALVDKVSKYVYNASENAMFSSVDSPIGQSIDFRG